MKCYAGLQTQPAEAGRALLLLRRRPGWSEAVAQLKALASTHGDAARAAAATYGAVYVGRRGAMVVDVVASRQRKYEARVVPLVARWSAAVGEPTLAALAAQELRARDFGLQESEPVTMQSVAANILEFAHERGYSEDDACRAWADGVEGLEHAHKLDPVVGGVPGIGPALFAYMRMRCGANTLKPDVRVATGLRELGFTTSSDGHSILVVARAAAAEVDMDLLSLDQLLWGRTG